MNLSIYFSPTNLHEVGQDNWKAFSLGKNISFYQGEDEGIVLKDFNIAIIGICEERNAVNNAGCGSAPDEVRKYLYQLSAVPGIKNILDLGNILPGETVEDTYFAVQQVIAELGKSQVTTIVLGGSQDLTFPIYQAFEQLEQMVNAVAVDPMFDIGDMYGDLNAGNYLSKIIVHQPNYLFNFSNIGFQSYFINSEELALMQRLNFDAYRLGWVRSNMEEVEAVVRNADILTFDISAVKYSDAPGNNNVLPNGFFGDEACRISRYAGISDKMSCFGLFEINPAKDQRGITANLASQIVWYFLDGFAGRKGDYPVSDTSKYLKYNVTFQDNEHLVVFYKSNKSERWWMEVPFPTDDQSKYMRHHLVPCSYKDYQTACGGDIPDRWWQTYNKLN